jgi:hypothetical protein
LVAVGVGGRVAVGAGRVAVAAATVGAGGCVAVGGWIVGTLVAVCGATVGDDGCRVAVGGTLVVGTLVGTAVEVASIGLGAAVADGSTVASGAT